MTKQKNKIIYVILLLVYILNAFSGIVTATQISSADLVNLGDCGRHLQFWDTKQNAFSDIITNYVGYNYQGRTLPAYCLEVNEPGVPENGPYTVNISTLLDRVDVWRTVTAGFPYRTAAQMGCSTDQDAYVATKQAIYCILDGSDPNGKYQGRDAQGVAIKNAIISLVNEGRNGTRTPQAANVAVNPVGELVRDGDYCYQEMSVSSFVNMAQYTVTSTAGFPDGAKVTNMSNGEQSTFGGSEHFKILIPTDQVKHDMNVAVGVRAKCETYPVFYGSAPNSAWQDYAITFDPMADEQGIAEFKIDTHKATIKVIKKDAELKEDKYNVPGVTFNFKYEDGEEIGNYTTDKNGEITINKLRPGKVIAKELSTNENYLLNEDEQTIELKYADEITKEVNNERKRGNLKVYKVDKDNNKVVLGHVLFDLYSYEQDKVIGSYRTDENGEIYIEDLRVADYALIEKETNRWYNLADNTELKIEWEKTTETTIENELKKGQIRVIKVDKENHEVKLEGVKFGVYDKDDNLLETIVTNKDGEATTQRYAVRDFESLKLVELETREEYVLNTEEKTIKLEANQIKDIEFENQRIKGKLQITKVDAKDKDKKLEGAKFGIYDANTNELLQTVVTDKDGKATTDYLYKGKYYAKELETGSDYYVLNENSYEFEIVEHDKIVEKEIENAPVEIEVDVDKEGTKEIKPGEPVDYKFTNVANLSNIYLEEFKWYDYIPTDYIRLESMTTGTWNQDLTYDVYYKTNKSEDYVLFKENLSTKENQTLDFKSVTLAEDEYITETMFDFGRVEKGFREVDAPTMHCMSLSTVKEGDVFTNYTETVGVYKDMTSKAKSKWTTIVHTPEAPKPTLPKTGK